MSVSSFRLEMMQVARLAPKVLGSDATDLIRSFVKSQFVPTGGFGDREGRADLYYTIFGIENALALDLELPWDTLDSYLKSFEHGQRLDFVHLCSWLRGLASAKSPWLKQVDRDLVTQHLLAHRCEDGGFHAAKGREQGSAYGSFLAWGAFSDLGVEMPDEDWLFMSMMSLLLPDGSMANEPHIPQGTVTTTAAMVTLSRFLQHELPEDTVQWLLQQRHPSGGFIATPRAPIPDLLSTATALYALDGLNYPLESLREPCLDFIDSLWSAEGGFHGHWADDHLDVEYTQYGLLALGHLKE